MHRIVLALIALVAALPSPPPEEGVSVETLPPVVVLTVPRSGDVAVDPTLAEIRVTFSKEMLTEKMWSWVQWSSESFPKTTGEPRYLEDARTCVLPVKLDPGKDYVVWVNSERHTSFRDRGDRPAVPYLIAFRTKG